jgi:hypothetical protein
VSFRRQAIELKERGKMGVRKSDKMMVFFRRLTPLRRTGGIIAGLVVLAMALVVACQPTVGVKPSPAKPTAAADTAQTQAAAATLNNSQCRLCHPEQVKIIGSKARAGVTRPRWGVWTVTWSIRHWGLR